MKIIFLGNCQAKNFEDIFPVLVPGVEVRSLEIHTIDSVNFKEKKDYCFDIFDDNTIILTHNIQSEQFGDWRTSILKKKYKHVYTLTNFYFSGIHPDCTYLRNLQGQQIKSPIGMYHSRIVANCFRYKKSIDECISSFNNSTYEEFKFYDYFKQSSEELLKRDKDIDFPFADQFIAGIKYQPSLLTINHVTSNVISNYIRFICNKLNLNFQSLPTDMLLNHNLQRPWWPVFPEIQQKMNLMYDSFYFFKQAINFGGKALSLEEFVKCSYAVYSKIDDIENILSSNKLV